MTPSEILTKAAKLITKETWCQGGPAYDAKGHMLYANEPGAVKWCLLGACCKVSDIERTYQLPKDLLGYIQDGIWTVDKGWDGGGPDSLAHPDPSVRSAAICGWNDDQVFKDVRDALLAAVELAEQDESHDRD